MSLNMPIGNLPPGTMPVNMPPGNMPPNLVPVTMPTGIPPNMAPGAMASNMPPGTIPTNMPLGTMPTNMPPPGTMPLNIAPSSIPPNIAPPNMPPNMMTSVPPGSHPMLLPPPGVPPSLTGNRNWSERSGDIVDNVGENNQNDLPSLLSLHVEKPDEDSNKGDVVLPKALEQVFALKDQRAAELGTELEESTKGKKIYQLNVAQFSLVSYEVLICSDD